MDELFSEKTSLFHPNRRDVDSCFAIWMLFVPRQAWVWSQGVTFQCTRNVFRGGVRVCSSSRASMEATRCTFFCTKNIFPEMTLLLDPKSSGYRLLFCDMDVVCTYVGHGFGHRVAFFSALEIQFLNDDVVLPRSYINDFTPQYFDVQYPKLQY